MGDWINSEAHWESVPKSIDDCTFSYPIDLQANFEIQESICLVKEKIKKELQKPRYICDVCKCRFTQKGNKVKHENTHSESTVCKKVSLNRKILLCFSV